MIRVTCSRRFLLTALVLTLASPPPARAFAPPVGCNEQARRNCSDGGQFCQFNEIAKCAETNARRELSDRAYAMAVTSFQVAAENWREAYTVARDDVRRQVAALVDYAEASAEAALILQDRLDLFHDAAEILDRVILDLEGEQVANADITSARELASACEHLRALILKNPQAHALELARAAAKEHARAVSAPADEEKTIYYDRAVSYFEGAAIEFRKARKRAKLAAHRRLLLDRELEAWSRAYEIRRFDATYAECELPQSALNSIASELPPNAEPTPELRAHRARFQVLLDRCQAAAEIAAASECDLEDCKARTFAEAARIWDLSLRRELAPNGDIRLAFPDANHRYALLVEMAEKTVWAYRQAAIADRNAVGRPTTRGHVLEEKAAALVNDLVILTRSEPLLQEQLRAIEVERLPPVRGKLVYPEGDFTVSGGVLLGLGAGLVTAGPVLLHTGALGNCDDMVCYVDPTKHDEEAPQRRFETAIGVMIAGGVVVAVGAALLGYGLSKRYEGRRSRTRAGLRGTRPLVRSGGLTWRF